MPQAITINNQAYTVEPNDSRNIPFHLVGPRSRYRVIRNQHNPDHLFAEVNGRTVWFEEKGGLREIALRAK